MAVILKYVQNAAGRGQTAIQSNLGNPSPFIFTPLQWVRVSTKSIMGIPKDWLCINLWFGSCFLCVVSFLGIWEGGLFRFCFCIFYGWGINVFGTKDIFVYYELGNVELGGWKYRHIANFRCLTFYIYAIVHGLLSIMQWHSHPHSPLQEYKKKLRMANLVKPSSLIIKFFLKYTLSDQLLWLRKLYFLLTINPKMSQES